MSVGSTFAGRATLDPAAFARFCETPQHRKVRARAAADHCRLRR